MQNQRSNFVNGFIQAGRVGLAQKILHSMKKLIHPTSLRSHQIYGGVSLYCAGLMLTQTSKTNMYIHVHVGFLHLTSQGYLSYRVIQVLLLLQLKSLMSKSVFHLPFM